MKKEKFMTNERFKKRFGNQFELVNYAVQIAANMIHTGRPARVKTPILNTAHQVLEEIAQDKDYFEEMPKETVEEEPSVKDTASKATQKKESM